MKGQSGGALYGTMYDNALLVIGLSVDASGCGPDPYMQLQTHFPTEIDFCGAVIFTDDTDNMEPSTSTLDIFKVSQVLNSTQLVRTIAYFRPSCINDRY